MKLTFLGAAHEVTGSSTLLEAAGKRILIDCGMSGKQTLEEMARNGLPPEELKAILITHEHSDHVKGAGILSRKLGLPVYATEGTWQGMEAALGEIPSHHRVVITANESFFLNDLEIVPFAIPHDANDPTGYRIYTPQASVAIATDLGLFADSVRDAVMEEARRIVKDEIRVLLLAGPSGAGKTTTANLIADAVRARGFESLVVSLDNFYRDHRDPDYPRLANGERDMESAHALRLDEVRDCLSRILLGQGFSIPKYDFKVGRATARTEHGAIAHGCVIVEGLHALNPAVAEHLPEGGVLRLFVSLSTNITEDGERLISGRKLRFLRGACRSPLLFPPDRQCAFPSRSPRRDR